MKLLVFSPYYPPHTGGLESHSEEFNRTLSTKGVSLTVFAPLLPDDSPFDESPQPGIRIIRYPAFEIISNFPAPKFWSPVFWRQLSSLSAEKFDFVLSRTRFFLSSLFALLYAKFRKLPLIHIEHGSDFVRLSSPIKTIVAKYYDLTIGRLVLRSSAINISISAAVQKFVARFDQRPSPIIYRGIDFGPVDKASASAEIRSQYPEKIIIITVARLYQWKGIRQSIEAIGQLSPADREKIFFLIVGDGEDFDGLQNAAAGLPVRLLGNRPRKEVFSILKSSDIYLHSSFPGGGLSTSLLEAMYAGRAVIATPHEGADEVVIHEKNGLLIDRPDPKIIAQALKELICNRDLRTKLGQSATETIRERFDWQKSIGRYLDILQSL